ncbi:hypothetical protein D5085_15740 [Ectothiorhodospiraceae bacterium BW-2]|nr:hypothetical protein D5085_15740 [Ectothiorhodospiraceae bacterium BW-2]
MLDRLLRLYWTVKRKTRLVRFFNGLNYLGRPGKVFFPVELIDQGLELILSGLNNTLAIQCNLDWVWPWWVEQQQNPAKESFIPTGINLVTTNLSQRNWCSIGVYGSCHESMVDPVGMLTLHPFGWSLLPYLRLEQQLYLPPTLSQAVRQSLLHEDLPVIITHYPIDNSPLQWQTTLRALEIDGEELIEMTQQCHNRGTTPLTITLGFSIRPYNALTVGHIHSIGYKKRLWRVNGHAAVLFLSEPNRHSVSGRQGGDPIYYPTPQSYPRHASRSGIAAGISEYDLSLNGGERVEITALGMVHKRSRRANNQFRNLHLDSLKRARERDLALRQQWRERGMMLQLPDASWQRLFYALKNHLPVFDDGSHFSPGTFFYHSHWFRDSSFIATAFDCLGLGEVVEPKFTDYLRRQTPSGFFRSQNGEWDSNGQAMVAMVNHCRRYGKTALLTRLLPALLKGARWIERMRLPLQEGSAKPPHAGLLPAGFSAEHFGPNDHYYWDNFWSLAGLEAVVWATTTLNHPKRRHYEQLLSEYRSVVEASMQLSLQRTMGGVLPCSPYRRIDSAAIGNLVAISPLGLFPPDSDWVGATTDYLWQNNLSQGLFYQKIIHTGLNVYLSVQLARVMLLRQDWRWLEIMAAIQSHASPLYTWPEAIHPATGGGCMGDGDHGWATADVLMLLRTALVTEEQQQLWLAIGVPIGWYGEGMRLSLNHAPTQAGWLDFAIEQHEKERVKVSWKLTPHPLATPMPLLLHLPRYLSATEGLTLGESFDPNYQRLQLPSPEGSLYLQADEDKKSH